MDYNTNQSENNLQMNSTMISQIFPSLHTPLRMPIPPTALAWLRPSPNSQCLVTGMQNGSIGITWYTNNSVHTTSLTLSHILSPISHVSASSDNKQVAVGGYYGTLMMLNVGEAPTVESRMLRSVNMLKHTILGLKWSWNGDRVACLRAKQNKSTPLSLMIYSNISSSQYNNIEMTFPRRIVGDAMNKNDIDTFSQRIAWNHDDASLFMTLTHNSLLQVSTQTWRIISSLQFGYSTQLHVVAAHQLIAVDTNNRLISYNTITNSIKELNTNVESIITRNDQIVSIINQPLTGRKLIISNSSGTQLNQFRLPVKRRIMSVSISPDSSMLFYTTPTEISSLILYSKVPTLKELCMTAINGYRLTTSRLPIHLQNHTSNHHNMLLPLGDEVDFCVHKIEKKRRFGLNTLSIVVNKHHLGQVLEVMRFVNSIGNIAKLKEMKSSFGYNERKRILEKLLPISISNPEKDTRIKWNNSRNKFTLHYNGEKAVLRFKEQTISITGCMEKEFKLVNRDGGIVIQSDEHYLATITKERNLSRLRLHTTKELKLTHTLLLALVNIIRN